MYPDLKYNPISYSLGNLSGGVALDMGESKIPDGCMSDMLNMVYREGVLKKRKGQSLLFSEEEIITALDTSYYNFFIYHASDKIKAYNTETKEITTLFAPVRKKEGSFFIYNGYVYYVGTGEYYKISVKDNNLLCEIVQGYIPTVLVNCDYNSVGDNFEEYNLLTGKFKLTYNTTNQTRNINFPEGVNYLKSVAVQFNNKPVTGYTLNQEGRYISFDSMEEGHNMLEITFEVTNEDRDKIVNCTITESFGGLNAGISEGTRMFFSGNHDYKTTFFYSELKNPEHFPVNQFDIIGDDFDPITGMGKQYDGLIFFKEKSIYISKYEYQGETVNFTLSRLNSEIGCDCKNTIATVGNQLVWLNSNYGVMSLFSTYIKEEKTVGCISRNINGLNSEKALLNQKDIKNSTVFIMGNALYLVTGKYTYMLPLENGNGRDEKSSWFILDNISCKAKISFNREIYLLGKKGATYFTNQLYDFDLQIPIRAYFKTKALDFNRPCDFKNIYEISLSLKAINNSGVSLKAWDENGKLKNEWEYRVNKFNFINFKFPCFTFMSNIFSFAVNRRLRRGRVKYLMLEFSNDLCDSQMSISDIFIMYSVERSVRFSGI